MSKPKTEPSPEEQRLKKLRDDLEEYREDHPKPWYLCTKTNYDRSSKGGVAEH